MSSVNVSLSETVWNASDSVDARMTLLFDD